jgi:hypothetical protein
MLLGILPVLQAESSFFWIEGEAASKNNAVPHSWYSGQIKKEALSGGDALSHWSDRVAADLSYDFTVPSAGNYEFWIRANPVQSRLSYALNGAEKKAVDFASGMTGNVNLATDNKPDLRFVAWVHLGRVPLKAGANKVRFFMESANHHHGILDCLVFSQAEFHPMGILKPDQMADHLKKVAAENDGWWLWNPSRAGDGVSPMDLRFLNEKVAGQNGFVRAEGGRFVLGSGEAVRFWAVNGPPEELRGEELKRCARQLAKHGVNLVRLHGTVFDERTGQLRPESIVRFQEVTEVMKAEGIYVHLSIYFPLWFKPRPGLDFLPGYDGQKHPFASLYFNGDFQKVYQDWWRQILTTKGANGKTLCDEPALMGVEMVNEDSLLFWTFKYDNVPAEQMAVMEKRFGDWLMAKYGSLEKALQAWGGTGVPQDRVAEGRMGFRNHWDMFTHKTLRDQDTARFLTETQRTFYDQTQTFLKGLGFRGLITASNWITANDAIFGPLEKYSYSGGDFIDRHGYFGGMLQGQDAAWSIRDGHVFSHRSALRFDPEEPGKAAVITHPVFDSEINGKPSMISETTFTRPNRYRTEAPLFYAVYGALQDTDSVVHFALDGVDWQVKPRFFMQPWTLATPAMMGQFPAAALIYRQGLVKEGEVMAGVQIPLEDAYALKGNPLSVQANLDELRKTDLKPGSKGQGAGSIDPLIHLVGRTRITIAEKVDKTTLQKLENFVDPQAKTVKSSTGEVLLDFGNGVLTVDGEKAQVVAGNVKAAGTVDLKTLRVSSGMDLLAVALVPLDNLPVQVSQKMLLQIMSEEKATAFQTEPVGEGRFRIKNIGVDPWLYRRIEASVSLNRPDAARLKVRALDLKGMPSGEAGNGTEIQPREGSVYYLIEK